MRSAKLLAFAVWGFMLAPHPAWAAITWFDRDTVEGVVSVGLATSNDLQSWATGGFGKTRFGQSLTGVASAEAVWRPYLTDDVSFVVDGVSQQRFGRPFDVVEAYALYKPVPNSPLHVQARAGLLYVPISLEHDSAPGEPWSMVGSITPSAINTWVGEELKAVGVEGRVERVFQSMKIATTLGVFSHNETSGTLLALRGWAFSDLVATATARVPLPPLSDYVSPRQADHTDPVDSFDGRLGAYAKLQLTNAIGSIDLTFYDNNAKLGAGDEGQWAWRTRFVDIGATVPLGANLVLTSQVVSGRTRAELGSQNGYPFDVRFRAAYARLVKTAGSETFSLRGDVFSTSSRHPPTDSPFYHPGPLDPDETYGENGWSGMTAWTHRLAPGQSIIAEFLYVSWKRDYLADFGENPKEGSATFRVAYQNSF